MKITEIRKKFIRLKNLISEYNTINATIKYMGSLEGRALNSEGAYLNNLRKRRDTIEIIFDEMLK
jgi:hypothetical protein